MQPAAVVQFNNLTGAAVHRFVMRLQVIDQLDQDCDVVITVEDREQSIKTSFTTSIHMEAFWALFVLLMKKGSFVRPGLKMIGKQCYVWCKISSEDTLRIFIGEMPEQKQSW